MASSKIDLPQTIVILLNPIFSRTSGQAIPSGKNPLPLCHFLRASNVLGPKSPSTVINKLLQSLIVTLINYDELLIGDKNAIIIAARILGYGQDYSFKYVNAQGQETEATVDLSKLEEKKIETSLYANGNNFTFTLPKSGNTVTFKLLTHGDEKKIDAEVKGLKKINPNATSDVTTRLKYIITSINGDIEQKAIRDFVDNYLLAPDARALREYYTKIQPDIEMKFIPEDDSYTGEGIAIPISLNSFWPDAGV